MNDYKIIIEEREQTVMAHFEAEERTAEGYQKQYEYYRNQLLTFEG